jgi:hypothetical protein
LRRILGILLSLSVLIAACGGASDSEDSVPVNDSQPQSTENDTEAPASTEDGEAEPSGNESVSGLGEATVTLNGDTFYFGETDFPALRCEPDTFGTFWVLLGEVDEQGNQVDNGGSLQLMLVVDGSDADQAGQLTEALITLPAHDQTWIADPEEIQLSSLDPGTSQVDEFTIDGNSVSGRATFFDRETWFPYSAGNADDFLVATATFEATCNG